jgi:hypothetical protein
MFRMGQPNAAAAEAQKPSALPWQHLDELAALWGHTPKAIRGDGSA